MERSAALNPASLPFFPGGLRVENEDNGIVGRRQDRTSFSTFSMSSGYRSATSSPSPPVENRERLKISNDWSRQSPSIRQVDALKSHPGLESRIPKELSLMGSLDTLHEGEDTANPEAPGLISRNGRLQTPGPSLFTIQQHHSNREQVSTPPTSIIYKSPSVYGEPVTSSSPVSSLDSGGHFSSIAERQGRNFEEQLMTSPFIQDLLGRVMQCELLTREIQRDVGDIQRNVNFLVERASELNSKPEFKNPFASAKSNGNSLTSPPINGARPSLGNIAPNQAVPADDITNISQRLNTLTSSVGQLLAIQTQQMHAANTGLHPNSVIRPNPSRGDVAPKQMMPTPLIPSTNVTPYGMSRNDVKPPARHPGPPMRTWSAGTLELPPRPSDPHAGRPDNVARDKRRSITSLGRRESSGIIDVQIDSPAGGSPRESGPVVSKWEQLSLAPELLRSLIKFGVGPPNKIQQRALPFLLKGSDIIAQAPPTQERIAAYVIPAIQIAVTHLRPQNRGPVVVMISTTVDQATQAQRMIRDLGGPIGVRSALGVGITSPNGELTQELKLLQQNMPHIICGTPQKLHALFTAPGGLVGSEVRFLVLDEVDQLIARNLHEFVFNISKLLPPPRTRPVGVGASSHQGANGTLQMPFNGSQEPSNGIISPVHNQSRRFSMAPGTSIPNDTEVNHPIERQTALFSNTVPQDVLNFASAIQLREPVRVLVRRDGNAAQSDPGQGSRGLRQFYLYLAFTSGGRSDPMAISTGGGLGIIGSGRGASNAETAQAREWKLDALADLFDDVEVTQAIVHVGGMTSLDSVVYKLASKGLEAVPLHGDMNAGTRLAALNKFRNPNSVVLRTPPTKILVVYDIQVKIPDVSHVPLVINYDLPKAVEEYAHRVAPAVASNYSRAGVVVNFVTATGGDVEMLRSIECFYKIKCPEVPLTLRDVL